MLHFVAIELLVYKPKKLKHFKKKKRKKKLLRNLRNFNRTINY